jgi:hypothetical protein
MNSRQNISESPFVKNASAIFTRGKLEMLKFVFIMIPGMLLAALFYVGGCRTT